MQPMETTAASNMSSPRSMRMTRPSLATSSSERTASAIGPKEIPEPWVAVDMTPATVWAS